MTKNTLQPNIKNQQGVEKALLVTKDSRRFVLRGYEAEKIRVFVDESKIVRRKAYHHSNVVFFMDLDCASTTCYLAKNSGEDIQEVKEVSIIVKHLYNALERIYRILAYGFHYNNKLYYNHALNFYSFFNWVNHHSEEDYRTQLRYAQECISYLVMKDKKRGLEYVNYWASKRVFY